MDVVLCSFGPKPESQLPVLPSMPHSAAFKRRK